jgi:predicted nuclease of predicted toxin-antitoxin system
VRFQFDEHMPHAVAHEPRRRGIEVITAHEAGLRGRPDHEVLAHAHAAGRVMVTNDDDYLRLHSLRVEHAGIAYCAPGARSIGQIVESLMLIHEVLEPDQIRGRLEYM